MSLCADFTVLVPVYKPSLSNQNQCLDDLIRMHNVCYKQVNHSACVWVCVCVCVKLKRSLNKNSRFT